MLAVLALVGRPNVGKSTLFNVLTRTRDALVADAPGLTRDRKYGYTRVGARAAVVIDTGGLVEGPDSLERLAAAQTRKAVEEADRVLLVVDGRAGLTPPDLHVADTLRRSGSSVLLVVNKAEGLDPGEAMAEFHALGLGEPVAVSAAHAEGLETLMARALEGLAGSADDAATPAQDAIRVAVIGRPNVGKSTLINRLLGEERLIAFNEPGTTRDSVYVPFERDGQAYVLIDTAGVRRRAKVEDPIEKFSVIKALQAIESAHVAVVVVDAQEDIGVQDARILGLVADSGRALVIAVNKWDGLDSSVRGRVKSEVDRKLPFLDYARVEFISALHGSGLGELMKAVNQAYRAATAELATPRLNEVLQQALEAHNPPAVLGRRIKLRYAHQGGHNPPVIVIHGNQTEKLPVHYRRYLVHRFREAFKLWGTPLRLVFKTGENPYEKQPRNVSRPSRRRKDRR